MGYIREHLQILNPEDKCYQYKNSKRELLKYYFSSERALAISSEKFSS